MENPVDGSLERRVSLLLGSAKGKACLTAERGDRFGCDGLFNIFGLLRHVTPEQAYSQERSWHDGGTVKER